MLGKSDLGIHAKVATSFSSTQSFTRIEGTKLHYLAAGGWVTGAEVLTPNHARENVRPSRWALRYSQAAMLCA